jgi:hypothetical protein
MRQNLRELFLLLICNEFGLGCIKPLTMAIINAGFCAKSKVLVFLERPPKQFDLTFKHKKNKYKKLLWLSAYRKENYFSAPAQIIAQPLAFIMTNQ